MTTITVSEQIALIHRAVQIVAGQCDGAVEQDGQGFNGTDTNFGKSLAMQSRLSPKQALAALKMVIKYERQIGEALTEQLKSINPKELEALTVPQAAPQKSVLHGGQTPTTATTAVDVSAPLDFETIVAWGPETEIDTRAGKKMIRKADATQDFWALWAARKPELQAAGITVGKFNGQWQVTKWPPRDQQPAAEPAKEVVALDLPEGIAAKCLPYQVPGASRLLSALTSYGVALDASDTGAGKTYMALAAVKAAKCSAIVLCPKAVKASWNKAARHFDMGFFFASNYEQFKNGNTPYCEATVTVKEVPDKKNPGKKKKIREVSFKWNLPKNCVVIFDEVHRCKARDSQNAEMLIAAKAAGATILMLSATAASNPLEMRALAFTLGLYMTEKGYFKWASQNGCARGRFGFEFKGGREVIKKIHHQIFATGKGNRIRIADLPDFPQSSIHAEVIDFDENTEEIKKAYRDMENELAALQEVSAKDRQGMILTEQLRARQKTELLKVPTLAEMAQDAIAEGMAVAIFVNFDEPLSKLAELLKTDCIISGRQQGERGEREREANIQRFQRCNRPRLTITCPTFSAQDLKQVFGRVWRAVDKNATPIWSDDCSPIIICNIRAGGVGVSLHHLGGLKSIQKVAFAAGTIEEEACAAVEAKIGNIDTLNDGDVLKGLKILPDAPKEDGALL
jgi:hypothetical protein